MQISQMSNNSYNLGYCLDFMIYLFGRGETPSCFGQSTWHPSASPSLLPNMLVHPHRSIDLLTVLLLISCAYSLPVLPSHCPPSSYFVLLFSASPFSPSLSSGNPRWPVCVWAWGAAGAGPGQGKHQQRDGGSGPGPSGGGHIRAAKRLPVRHYWHQWVELMHIKED